MCDVCGQFISYADLDSGKATHEMLSPDSDVSSEEWETLCPKHKKELDTVTKLVEWQQREKHVKEVKHFLQATGCMNSKGEIRKWTKDTWIELNTVGHTSMDFQQCKCRD